MFFGNPARIRLQQFPNSINRVGEKHHPQKIGFRESIENAQSRKIVNLGKNRSTVLLEIKDI